MSRHPCVRILILVGLCSATAFAAVPMGGWKSLPGSIYLIHGGSLADRQTPTSEDRKLSIVIDGQPAKEIFDMIGPDLPETCSGDKGDRTRDRKGLHCTFTAGDQQSKEGPYRCWVGLDLRTGDSVGLVSC